MGILLRLIGALGVLLFGLFFCITFGVPVKVEESAKGFVKSQIEKEIREKYQHVVDSSLANKALAIAGNLGLEEKQIEDDIENKLPEKIAAVLSAMCGYDCEKKKALTQSITNRYLDRIKNIKVAKNTLEDLIKGKYIQIIENLKIDLRIFLGTNLVMFLFLLLVSFLKSDAITHLFLPGMLLLLSTVLASSIYIFGQDWFYTILYNDYMGYTYLVYISIIFGVLVDIVFNKARITTEILNALANAVGSAFSVAPC